MAIGRRSRARELALQILYQCDETSAPPEDVVSIFWESEGVPPDDIRRFAVELVRGVQQRREEIDGVIRARAEHWAPERMAKIDRNILRLALHELLHREDIPPKVTINEYVELAKRYSTEESGGFVNGILDRAWRESVPEKG